MVAALPQQIHARLDFEKLWKLHPTERHAISMFGRDTLTPRFQQAYGVDYRYSGTVNRALVIPSSLVPLLRWVNGKLGGCLNGLLLNWYDAAPAGE